MAHLEVILTLLVVALPLLWLGWAANRQMCLFRIEVEAGKLARVWGRMPPRLLGDVMDVLALHRPRRVRMRCMLESGRAVVSFSDDSDAEIRQVLRNLVGQYPALRLRQSPRVRKP